MPAQLAVQKSHSCFTGRSKLYNLKAYASDVTRHFTDMTFSAQEIADNKTLFYAGAGGKLCNAIGILSFGLLFPITSFFFDYKY